jgi:hypothetical protein
MPTERGLFRLQALRGQFVKLLSERQRPMVCDKAEWKAAMSAAAGTIMLSAKP